MVSSLSFVAVEPTPDLFAYVRDHAQNRLVLEMIHLVAKSPKTQPYVILPPLDSFPQEEIINLSVGWRIFPPDSIHQGEAHPLIRKLLLSYLSSNNKNICLFPSEFSPDGEFQKSRRDKKLSLDNYPYIYVDNASNESQLIDAHSISGGYLYNGLLFEVAEEFDSWEDWFNDKKSSLNLATYLNCIIVEAYDGDSFLLIVPERGISRMNKVMEAALNQSVANTD